MRHVGSNIEEGGSLSDDHPTDDVVSAVLTASRVLVAVSARSLAAVEDRLTLVQFRALVVLAARGPVNLNGLATALGVTASSALRTIDRLVALELVERRENAQNRREVVLSTTDAGALVVDEVTSRRRAEITDVLGRMSARNQAALVSAFRSFARAADEPLTAVPDLTSLSW